MVVVVPLCPSTAVLSHSEMEFQFDRLPKCLVKVWPQGRSIYQRFITPKLGPDLIPIFLPFEAPEKCSRDGVLALKFERLRLLALADDSFCQVAVGRVKLYHPGGRNLRWIAVLEQYETQ